MKVLALKLIVTTFFTSMALLFVEAASPLKNSNSELVDSVNTCRYGQCHATAKSTGNRCKHCVSNQGDLYCSQH